MKHYTNAYFFFGQNTAGNCHYEAVSFHGWKDLFRELLDKDIIGWEGVERYLCNRYSFLEKMERITDDLYEAGLNDKGDDMQDFILSTKDELLDCFDDEGFIDIIRSCNGDAYYQSFYTTDAHGNAHLEIGYTWLGFGEETEEE